MGHAPRAALFKGRQLEGRKYGILKFGRFLRIGVCTAELVRREFALLVTPKLSVLFVTVHTSAIVTMRISIADLICGAATQTFAPGGKHPCADTGIRVLCRLVCAGPIQGLGSNRSRDAVG